MTKLAGGHSEGAQIECRKADAGTIDLVSVFAEAIRALSALDVPAIETLEQFLEGDLEQIALPVSRSEWTQLRSHRWVLGHLLDETRRRLQMLERISISPARFGNYDAGALRELSPKRIPHADTPHGRSSRFNPAN